MLALFDVDGVLTDGKVIVTNGSIAKTISYTDIDGIFALKKAGYDIGFITAEPQSSFTDYLAGRFDPCVHLVNAVNKWEVLHSYNLRYGDIDLENFVYTGDSHIDIELLKRAKMSFCPADSPYEVRVAAKRVLTAKRGNGVIREVADILLDGEGERTPIDKHLELISCINTKKFIGQVQAIAKEIAGRLKEGNKILICGNGGSAADAQHFAAELVGKFQKDRDPYPAVALTTNTSIITAVGNDLSYNEVFSRQVEAEGRRGDIFIGISTSGVSLNVIKAASKAEQKGMYLISLTGFNSKIPCHRNICIPASDTARIQEAHILVLHMLAEYIEQEMG